MTMNRTVTLTLILAALWGAGLGCGDDSSTGDTGDDDGAVETTEGGADADVDPDVTPDAEVVEEAETTPDADVVEEAETTPDADVVEEAETTPDGEAGVAICGNGVVEAPEVCDDGNTDNEGCDTTDSGACLADCTLLMADCGDAAVDAGEGCDDGNDDSYDSFTTSCTVNDQSIGAPCRCTSGCDDTDPTAGTIVGCDNVVIPAGSGGVLACGRSVHIAFPAMDIYSVEGSCTVMALSCSGGAACGFAPVVGDVDTFACPTGYNETTDVRTVMGSTLTTKVCGKPCAAENNCRWNAFDPRPPTGHPSCGQWQCREDVDTGLFSCGDARM